MQSYRFQWLSVKFLQAFALRGKDEDFRFSVLLTVRRKVSYFKLTQNRVQNCNDD